jgi:hypothetical protein
MKFTSVSQYHQWLFELHCAHLFRFDAHLSREELMYIRRCAELSERHERPGHGAEDPNLAYLSYSHRVRGNERNSSRLAYGSIGAPEAALAAATPVLAERRVDLKSMLPAPGLLFYGLGWDFEAGDFKVYYRVPDVEVLRSTYPTHFRHAPQRHLREGLWSASVGDGQVREEKIYFYPSDEPVDDPVAVRGDTRTICSSGRRGAFVQYDVTNTAPWYDRVNTKARSLIDFYEDHGIGLDAIAYGSAEDCTLYFPRDPLYLGGEEPV